MYGKLITKAILAFIEQHKGKSHNVGLGSVYWKQMCDALNTQQRTVDMGVGSEIVDEIPINVPNLRNYVSLLAKQCPQGAVKLGKLLQDGPSRCGFSSDAELIFAAYPQPSMSTIASKQVATDLPKSTDQNENKIPDISAAALREGSAQRHRRKAKYSSRKSRNTSQYLRNMQTGSESDVKMERCPENPHATSPHHTQNSRSSQSPLSPPLSETMISNEAIATLNPRKGSEILCPDYEEIDKKDLTVITESSEEKELVTKAHQQMIDLFNAVMHERTFLDPMEPSDVEYQMREIYQKLQSATSTLISARPIRGTYFSEGSREVLELTDTLVDGGLTYSAEYVDSVAFCRGFSSGDAIAALAGVAVFRWVFCDVTKRYHPSTNDASNNAVNFLAQGWWPCSVQKDMFG